MICLGRNAGKVISNQWPLREAIWQIEKRRTQAKGVATDFTDYCLTDYSPCTPRYCAETKCEFSPGLTSRGRTTMIPANL
jgi:hypothetical protein